MNLIGWLLLCLGMGIQGLMWVWLMQKIEAVEILVRCLAIEVTLLKMQVNLLEEYASIRDGHETVEL